MTRAELAADGGRTVAVPTAVVFGAGAPAGLGAALGRRFAREGHAVFLAGRTQAGLDLLAEEIRAHGDRAQPRLADATRERDVVALLDEADTEGTLDLVVYNVVANAAVPLLDLSADRFETLWRQAAFGGFLVAREAVRRMVARGCGTILFTGATASLRARPPFTGFAAAKAALRAVAQGVAREYGPRGIHAVHVIIDGVIAGDYADRHFPDLVAAREEDGRLAPDAIADLYWILHRQPRSAWTHEVDLRPFKEPF